MIDVTRLQASAQVFEQSGVADSEYFYSLVACHVFLKVLQFSDP